MRNRSFPRERLSPIIILVVMAMIPAAMFGYVWRWAAARQVRPAPAEAVAVAALPAPLTTPVLSLRRAPQTLASTTNEAGFVSKLSDLSAFVGDTSCLVVLLDGRSILNHGGDMPITPASNEKLLTASVALEALGPDYTFSTKLLGAVTNGVVAGDLYFVGGGDPLLSTADYPASITLERHPPTNVTQLETLVANLMAAGVTSIQGNIVGDDSRYDTERFVPSWGNQIAGIEAGPLGALMVNDATRTLGTVVRYPDPAVGAATDLKTLLVNGGITVRGRPVSGTAPPDIPEIAAVQSAPLATIIAGMLTASDDNTAELLLKEIGFHYNGSGTRAAGIEVIKGTLTTWGIDATKVAPVDGSGLDEGNVVTCDILLQVLLHAPLTGPVGAGLPIAGQTGTLYNQFLDTPMVGRLHAKTGTLRNAKALTGYVDTTAGQIEFSLILDFDNAASNYAGVWQALGQTFSTYPTGPTIEQLQPR